MEVEIIRTKDLTGRLFADKKKTEVTVYRETMLNAATGDPLIHDGYDERDALRKGITEGRPLGELGNRFMLSAKHIGHVFLTPTRKGPRAVPMTNDQIRIMGALIGTLKDEVSPGDYLPRWAEIQGTFLDVAGPLPLEWGQGELYAALGRWWRDNRDKPMVWLTQPLRAALSSMVWAAPPGNKPEEKAPAPDKVTDAKGFEVRDMRITRGRNGMIVLTVKGRGAVTLTREYLLMENAHNLWAVFDSILESGEYRVSDEFSNGTLDSYARDLTEKFRDALKIKGKARVFSRRGKAVVPNFEIGFPQESFRQHGPSVNDPRIAHKF